jgi:hypothetical protein
MKFSEFYKRFPDESTCVLILKEIKEREGIICKKCSNDAYYWKNDKKSFECKKCKYRMSLKRGTIMENSNLPLKYWMSSIVFFKIMKEEISALALQRAIGHKRYEPIWLMVKRIKNMTDADFLIRKISDYIAIERNSIYLKNRFEIR